MIKLYIDMSDREKIKLKLNEKPFVLPTEHKSQKLIGFIEEVLKKEEIKLTDLTEIEVFPGPGSFTGLRVGVSVAQTLGFALNIPVNGYDIKKGEQVKIKY